MKTISQVLSYILPVLYLVVIYFYYQIYTGKGKKLLNKTTWILIVLLVIHAVEIVTRHLAIRTIPLSTAQDALSFLAFSVLFVYMILEVSVKNRGSGIFILSFAFVFDVISSIQMDWEPVTNPLLLQSSAAIHVHTSISIMGYTALALSALYAVMYIIQNKNIKQRNLGRLFNQLPALTYLEKMSVRSILIGVILLGIGILHGHIVAKNVLGSFWINDLKVIVSDLIWVIYLMGISLARLMKWRGVYMAYFSIFGFVFLILGGSLIMYFVDSFHVFN